jgi:arsenate reductase
MSQSDPNHKLKLFTEPLNDSEIESSRIERLNNITESLSSVYRQNNSLNLNFICTHNSRRSQIAQVWMHYFSQLFHLNIQSYSSGTEITKVHPNILNVLEEAGFEIKKDTRPVDNPIFKLSFSKKGNLIELFSKSIDDQSLPKKFVAISTCSQADENCPFIPQARMRFSLTYDDPGKYDGSDREIEAYRLTNKQIATELFYLISKLNA